MSDPTSLTPEQCRAARALLGWSRSELSSRSHVASSTLADLESGKREPHARTLADIRRVLEAAGVAFQDAGIDGGPGVRFVTGGSK